MSNNPIHKAGGVVLQRHGSASELRILESLSTEQWTSASRLAEKVWEKQRGPVGKRAGQWQRMGAMLHKLYARGLVHKMTTEHAQNLWRRRRTPNAALCDPALRAQGKPKTL